MSASLIVADTNYGFSDCLTGNQLIIDGSGNYWVVLIHKSSSILSVFMSADSGVTWTGPLGEGSSPSMIIGVSNPRATSICSGLFGSVIRVAYRVVTTAFLAVVDFDLGTSTWGSPIVSSLNGEFKTTSGGVYSGSGSFQPLCGIVLSNGDVVIACPGMLGTTTTGWGSLFQGVFTVFSNSTSTFSAFTNIVDSTFEFANLPANDGVDGMCRGIAQDPVTGNICFLMQGTEGNSGALYARFINSSYSFVDSAVESFTGTAPASNFCDGININDIGILTTTPPQLNGVAYQVSNTDPSLTLVGHGLITNLFPTSVPNFIGSTVSDLHNQSLFAIFGAYLRSGAISGFVAFDRYCIPSGLWDNQSSGVVGNLFNLPTGYWVSSIVGSFRSDNLTYDLIVYTCNTNNTNVTTGAVYYVTGILADSGCSAPPPATAGGWTSAIE